MKVVLQNRRPSPASRGYTLVEAMISTAIFLLVISAVLTCHVTGLSFNLAVQAHIQNVQTAREALTCMSEEVQSANSLQVGAGTATQFTAVGVTNLQAGNAVRIYPTTNTSQFIYYYCDTNHNFNKIPLNSSQILTLATGVTNSPVFSLQNYSGTVLTNSQNNAALSVVLQMSLLSPFAGVSAGYQAGMLMTRRNIY